MKNPPVTIGIDPAAPNGDHSAMAVIQGNQVQSIVYDEFDRLMAKHVKDSRVAKALRVLVLS